MDKSMEDAAGEYAEKHSFRVPYDGSNKFYDDNDFKWSKEGFIAGAEWSAIVSAPLQAEIALLKEEVASITNRLAERF